MEIIIEYLRRKMMQLAEQRGSLVHPDVVAVSQQLDSFLVLIQRKRVATGANAEGNVTTVNPLVANHQRFVSTFKFEFVRRPLSRRSHKFLNPNRIIQSVLYRQQVLGESS